MSQIDALLEDLLPIEIKPIKGYLYTYYTSNFRRAIAPVTDLQDNRICHCLTDYLGRAFESLGKNLYIDILFNDINADNYFEVYSDFSLSRIHAQIERYNYLNRRLFIAILNSVV